MTKLSRADRQRLIQQDALATRMVPQWSPPRAEPASYAPGVQVVMSTHRRPGLLLECLASIEAGMKGLGLRWNLVVGVDGKDVATEAILRAHVSGADRFIWWPFDKARSVAQAKNRVLAIAKREGGAYPWLLFMDDDDLFLRARVTQLLPETIRLGHKASAGDWQWTDSATPNVRPRRISVFSLLKAPEYQLAPQSMCIHLDLVPGDGRFFDEDVTIFEDGLKWNELRGGPHEVAPLPTADPAYHGRKMSEQSASRPTDRFEENARLIGEVASLGRLRYGKRFNADSYATVCVGPRSLAEGRLLLEGLFRFGVRRPIHVVCDPESAEALSLLESAFPLHLHPFVTPQWACEERRKFTTINPGYDRMFPYEIMAAKQHAMRLAVEAEGNTLYLDSDMIPVGDLGYDHFPAWADACFCHHHWGTATAPSIHGEWQAGAVFCRSHALVSDWLRTFYLSGHQFTDQASLMAVATRHAVGELPPGYNIGRWALRAPGGRAQDHATRNGLHATPSGIWWQGTRVRFFHQHTHNCGPENQEESNRFDHSDDHRRGIQYLLETSPDPRHRELLPFYGA